MFDIIKYFGNIYREHSFNMKCQLSANVVQTVHLSISNIHCLYIGAVCLRSIAAMSGVCVRMRVCAWACACACGHGCVRAYLLVWPCVWPCVCTRSCGRALCACVRVRVRGWACVRVLTFARVGVGACVRVCKGYKHLFEKSRILAIRIIF